MKDSHKRRYLVLRLYIKHKNGHYFVFYCCSAQWYTLGGPYVRVTIIDDIGVKMEVLMKSGTFKEQNTECLVLFVHQDTFDSSLKKLDAFCTGISLVDSVSRSDLKKESGSTLLFPVSPIEGIKRILFVSLGEKKAAPALTHQAFTAVASTLQKLNVKCATLCLDSLASLGSLQWYCQHLVQALVMASYRFSHFKSLKNEKISDMASLQVTLLYNGKVTTLDDAVRQGHAVGHGVNVARNLGNLPGNICTPKYLAQQATLLASKNDQVTVDIFDESAMDALGMHAFLSVSQGSVEEGQFIILKYQGGKKNDAPYVLIGKGVTFDSGGISMKPSARMDEMKFDMCGAASIMGVMAALIELRLPLNVISVIVSAENMPGSRASKPGDIVTSLSGKHIEILNTDAEGRLLLCDALTYVEQFQPKVVIDVATLTGACIVALGHHLSGLFSNNDLLANSLIKAGKNANDEVWRMPLDERYLKPLESNFADVSNIATADHGGGSVVAACFLAEFSQSYSWAHLDIAGTAWKSGKEKGATGRPVPLLASYLISQAP